MSLTISVYTQFLSDDLIPKIVKRLNDFDMSVEGYPNFSFQEEQGFLPFKFSLTDTHLNSLKGKVLKSGFELYVDNFDLQSEKQKLVPKPTFFQKLLGRKGSEMAFAEPEIEDLLTDCKKVVSCVFNAEDSFEFRFACLTGAVLAKLTGGVYRSSDDIWYTGKDITEEVYKEVKEYEQSLTEVTVQFHEFAQW
ncbi:hypothetical protein GCM10028806_05140 [Spirosoma terrae]|uniref:Uncharacterized protein n=1 Tax=Spirosoma terrae TaxID=1968276 RepID=A0A6L9LFX1_9BACT|nr:hypothetical protein [Spirosoma terrae]NDU98242.1 hypothetical protein [Spirosoma terrae]